MGTFKFMFEVAAMGCDRKLLPELRLADRGLTLDKTSMCSLLRSAFKLPLRARTLPDIFTLALPGLRRGLAVRVEQVHLRSGGCVVTLQATTEVTKRPKRPARPVNAKPLRMRQPSSKPTAAQTAAVAHSKAVLTANKASQSLRRRAAQADKLMARPQRGVTPGQQAILKDARAAKAELEVLKLSSLLSSTTSSRRANAHRGTPPSSGVLPSSSAPSSRAGPSDDRPTHSTTTAASIAATTAAATAAAAGSPSGSSTSTRSIALNTADLSVVAPLRHDRVRTPLRELNVPPDARIAATDPGIGNLATTFIGPHGPLCEEEHILHGLQPSHPSFQVLILTEGMLHRGSGADALAILRTLRRADNPLVSYNSLPSCLTLDALKTKRLERLRLFGLPDAEPLIFGPERFRQRASHRRKSNRVIDRYWRRVWHAGATHFAYGSATFKPAYRAHRAVPVKGVYERMLTFVNSVNNGRGPARPPRRRPNLCRSLTTSLLDEYNSSKISACCGVRLHAVQLVGEDTVTGGVRSRSAKSRDLVYCGCCRRVLGRDEQAALNLLQEAYNQQYRAPGPDGVVPRLPHLAFDRPGSGFLSAKILRGSLLSWRGALSSAARSVSIAEAKVRKANDPDKEEATNKLARAKSLQVHIQAERLFSLAQARGRPAALAERAVQRAKSVSSSPWDDSAGSLYELAKAAIEAAAKELSETKAKAKEAKAKAKTAAREAKKAARKAAQEAKKAAREAARSGSRKRPATGPVTAQPLSKRGSASREASLGVSASKVSTGTQTTSNRGWLCSIF